MLLDIGFVVAGLALLMFGGDWLVRGATEFARSLGLSPLLIGVTLVGFGTSTPELLTSLFAAYANAPDIAVGNVVGSNIANILLILGLAAVLAPMRCDQDGLARDGVTLAVATLACVGALLLGVLSRPLGATFLLALLIYLVVAVATSRNGSTDEAPITRRASRDLGLALVGIAGVIGGAYLLVGGATGLARDLGVPEAVIGLTVVAVGTSLPELAATIAAAARRNADLAFGNIVGSNIFNVLAILGVTAVVKPIPVAPQIASFDGWVMLAATAALLALAFWRRRVGRLAGAVFLAGYAGYVGWLAMHAAP